MIEGLRTKVLWTMIVLSVTFVALTFVSPWFLIGVAITGALSLVGIGDFNQSSHSLLRNCPIIGHLRYLVEDTGPELHQYLIEANTEGVPFDRDTRSLMYQRAKNVADKKAFGTERNVYAIVVVRDPVDRAYSNWTHLWSDGLEPIEDFLTAARRRTSASRPDGRRSGTTCGWDATASSWRTCLTCSPASRSTCCATGTWSSPRVRPSTRSAGSWGWSSASRTPSRPRTCTPSCTRRGARAGSAPPSGPGPRPARTPLRRWRAASVPLTWALQRGGGRRPPLPVEARRQLVGRFADDVDRLSALIGEDFGDWLGDEGQGELSARAVGAAL